MKSKQTSNVLSCMLRQLCLVTALVLIAIPTGALADDDYRNRPIILNRSGGFEIGGKILQGPLNQTLSCDHGYVEYFIPQTPRSTTLVMWHSSSTQVFQNRWDGGEGYKDKFLRRNYPVMLWDGPRVGRANWACETVVYTPSYRDQGNFAAWNFGPYYKKWWPDVQFPTTDEYAWEQATSARYDEFDTDIDVQRHSDAMSIAADSGKLGKNIVYLTNSAGGLRAQMSVTKSNTTNIKGIVTYESIGYVFPDIANVTSPKVPGFGPFIVPLERFKKLANLTAIQFVWGDHRDESSEYVKQSRLAAMWINKYGGNATVLKLGEQKDNPDMKGNTHIAFADMNNEDVAGLLDDFLGDNGLDGYPDDVDDDQGVKKPSGKKAHGQSVRRMI